jgi:hypothetical protein
LKGKLTMATKSRKQAKAIDEDMVLKVIEEYDEYSNSELANRIGVSTARLTKIVNLINEKAKAKGSEAILGSKNLRKQDDVISNAVDIYLKEKKGK